MPLLRDPHLDLTTSRIEVERCILIPFSLETGVDISEFRDEFAKANKDCYVAPNIPTYEEEIIFIRESAGKIAKGEEFENFILEKGTSSVLGAGGVRVLESGELNIGIWIREGEQGKGYATEVYRVLIEWCRENTDFTYLKHSLDPRNEASRGLALKFGGILQEEKTKSGHDVYHIPLKD